MPIAPVAGLRPTGERIRETLFNWLQDSIQGAQCLDLFAGTGALGFEALSRGAASILFVERSKIAADTILASANSLDTQDAEVVQLDALTFLQQENTRRFDLVFLDPPFDDDNVKDLCRLLVVGNWLKLGAKVYLEQDKQKKIAALPDGWNTVREKTAGQVRYTLINVA